LELVDTEDLLAPGGLRAKGFTALLVPGGFAGHYKAALGDDGAAAVRKFVAAGGGYIGICAGAYLGTEWGLALVPCEVNDPYNWRRGQCPAMGLRWSAKGSKLTGLANGAQSAVVYRNGPVLRVRSGVIGAEVVARFDTELTPRKLVTTWASIGLNRKLSADVRRPQHHASNDWGSDRSKRPIARPPPVLVRSRKFQNKLASQGELFTDVPLDVLTGASKAHPTSGHVQVPRWRDVNDEEIADSGASMMRGSAAIVAGVCGRGRVVLISPHLEAPPSKGGGRVLNSLVQFCSDGCPWAVGPSTIPTHVRLPLFIPI
jgi:putative intracellular protease/amidase